jgi:hypothetical protein
VKGAPPPRAGGWTRALVVFSGHARLWWLRALRPGFRHCFVVLGSPAGWVSVDPLAHCTDVAVLPVDGAYDMAGWLRGRGYTVVETRLRPVPLTPAPWRPATCVETVKRILGVRAGWVLTPWQLFRFLVAEEKYSLTTRNK